ncbi:hypothetical protein AB0K15_34925 [Amycolatopsis sp. NPDC049253]|uniref:hypothetical protein n=1 Tax=Amycolatopsis sp. NPDC049253 TaxID=3155274 RepID=UPI0034498974
MALIVHRCHCGHIDLFHHGRTDELTAEACTGCTGGTHEFGPPEVIPSWRSDAADATAGAVPDPDPVEPGIAGAGLPTLCGCPDCRALYNQTLKEIR